MEIEESLTDLFDKTVENFIAIAKSKESELSIPQVSSSLLYSAACYNGRYGVLKNDSEILDMDGFIQEHVQFYEQSLRSAIKHYSGE